MLIIPQNRTFLAKISAKRNNEYITLQSGQKFIFCLKRSLTDDTPVIAKDITSTNIMADGHSYQLSLSYTETDITSGYYYYDVTYYTSGGAFAVIPTEECYISPATYRRAAND